MEVDLPKCGRCCFCFPIRYGLLVWAYIKMLYGAFMLVVYSYNLHWFVNNPKYYTVGDFVEVITYFLLIFYNCFTTLFGIVAAHKKSVKLFGIYLRVETVAILGNIIGIVVNLVLETIYYIQKEFHLYFLYSTFFLILIVLLFIGTQVYVLLLVRSKMDLMTNKEGFRFTNIGAEAECANNDDRNANVVIENEVADSDRDKASHDANEDNHDDSKNKPNNNVKSFLQRFYSMPKV